MNNLGKELAKFLESQGVLEEFIKNPDKTKELMLSILKYGYESLMTNEIDTVLGYKKYDKETEKENYRNGKRYRDLDTSHGKIINLEVPRARNGFYPAILERYKRRLENIDDTIIKLYAKGLSTEDISEHIKDIYGMKYSKETISNITEKVKKDIEGFKNRKLEESYYVIFIDAMHVNIRRDTVSKEAIYFLLGVNVKGKREILGFYINPTESASFYNEIFEDINSRGVKKVLLFVTDGLRGIEEVISNNFPKSKIQRCIYHLSRNISTRVRVRDRGEILLDFKKVYSQTRKEEALFYFEQFKIKWGRKYKKLVKDLEEVLDYMLTFYEFPESIRRQIYTTNWIERLNEEVRKRIKGKNSFPTVESAEKLLFLILKDYENRWEERILRGFGQAKYELDLMLKKIYG